MISTRPKAQSYIIKRPRLTKLLDESEARIILLCAPAGYGKTTLAREWVETLSEPVAWYSGGTETVDHVAFAGGLSEVLAAAGLLAHGAEPQARSTALGPRELARSLAARVKSDNSATLVIDDYHEAVGSHDSEEFVRKFVGSTSIRVVIATRIAPSWLKARMNVYGSAVSLAMTDLAFDADEGRAVLAADAGSATEVVLVQAQGWPAVIGLAALRADARARVEAGLLPADLYRYFAEDLFAQAPPDLKEPLFVLALAGGGHESSLTRALGYSPLPYFAAAADYGFATNVGADVFEIHPLLQSFLITRLNDELGVRASLLAEAVVTELAADQQWDACLATLTLFALPHTCAQTLDKALEPLLADGRTSTVNQWLALARDCGSSHPSLLIAEAELALRAGDDARAQVLSQHAASLLKDGELAARAHLIASRAALLRGDEGAAESNSQAARQAAKDPATQALALWLELLQAIERSEDAPAKEVLARLVAIKDPSPTHALRVHNARAYAAFEIDGQINFAAEELDLASGLLAHVPDPLLRANFTNLRSQVHLYRADYERVMELTAGLLAEVQETGLDFVIDHALLARAGALTGMRKIGAAQRVMQELQARQQSSSTWIRAQMALRTAFLHLTAGDLPRADETLRQSLPSGLPVACYAEWDAARALILAGLGKCEEALNASHASKSRSSYVDATDMAGLAEALVRLQVKADSESLVALAARLFETGGRNALVYAYRAKADLLTTLLGSPALEQPLIDLLAASRDSDIARAAGLRIPRSLLRTDGLSPREREVYELLVRGRTNVEISQILYISESTVKVHVRHIYEKLDVHTRAEAAALNLD